MVWTCMVPCVISSRVQLLSVFYCITVGDADFTDVEIASVAGLLKLYLVSNNINRERN